MEGTEGVYLYEGEAKADEEGTVSVTVKGKVELSADEEGSAVHSRGENVTYYLAWEHMDLSHPSNRYRDEPEQKDYDWAKWRMNIVSGVAVAAGVAVLAASGVGFLVGTGVVSVGGATGAVTAAGAAKATGMAVFLTGSLYVAEQAVSDAVSGRLSETEQYARKALAGSVVGFLTGASGLLMQGSGLGKVLALGFGEGFLGSAATQALLNEDGEINWALAFGEGVSSAIINVGAWKPGGNAKNSAKKIVGGDDALEGGSRYLYSVDSTMFPDDEAAGVLRNGEYVKNPTAHNINDYISDTSNYLGSKNMNGQYMYVIDMNGNIIIGTRGGQRMPHPTLIGGSNPQVQAAGIIEIRGGKIYSINNASGHFKPSIESLKVAEDIFSNLPQKIFSKDFQGYLSYGE